MEKTNGHDYAFQSTPECLNATLTKREYIATMIFQGLVINGWKSLDEDNSTAKLAVRYADELITELNKQEVASV